MDIRKSILITSVFMASATAGALAQTAGRDIISEMVSAVDGKKKAATAPTQQALNAEMAGILGFITGTQQPAEEASANNDQIMGVLNAMNPLGALNYVNDATEGDGLGALNYLTAAYGGNGYYQTGFWGKQSNGGIQVGFDRPLPAFDTEDFYRPVWGQITSTYGYRPKFGRMHYGVDLALNIGDTVRSALPGVVDRIGYEVGGYGNYLVLKHSNGVETRYAHLNSTIAMPGQRVEAGEPIAIGGNTGNSTGPHLHFEARYMGTPVDPLKAFDFTGLSMRSFTRVDGKPVQTLATGFNGSKTSLKDKSTYVVRQGDTPKKIAKRAGISVLRLCQLNFITENTQLNPGTMLKLK